MTPNDLLGAETIWRWRASPRGEEQVGQGDVLQTAGRRIDAAEPQASRNTAGLSSLDPPFGLLGLLRIHLANLREHEIGLGLVMGDDRFQPFDRFGTLEKLAAGLREAGLKHSLPDAFAFAFLFHCVPSFLDAALGPIGRPGALDRS
jgi:hypothetical protein